MITVALVVLACALMQASASFLRNRAWWHTWICFLCSFCALSHDAEPSFVIWATSAGLHGWMAWKQRKPRQRKPLKVTGRVRDLGHRLVTT